MEKNIPAHYVTVSEILTDEFVSANTTSSSFKEFMQKSGVVLVDELHGTVSDEEALNSYVARHSSFDTWEAMLEGANNIYTARMLNR